MKREIERNVGANPLFSRGYGGARNGFGIEFRTDVAFPADVFEVGGESVAEVDHGGG